jgi:hypothetical protein
MKQMALTGCHIAQMRNQVEGKVSTAKEVVGTTKEHDKKLLKTVRRLITELTDCI